MFSLNMYGLDKNYILIYSAHNEGKSVITEMFKKTKIYKKMTPNNSKSYLLYLKKLVGQYNNASFY